VILDAKQHAPAQRARDTPDMLRVEHVPEMEPAGGRRGETRQRRGPDEMSQALNELGEHAAILYNFAADP
jgi:hypothetical protein